MTEDTAERKKKKSKIRLEGNWETRESPLHKQRQESSPGKLAPVYSNSRNSSILVIGS